MRKRGMKKTLAFIVIFTMVFTMAYTPLGAAYAAVKSTWTKLSDIEEAAAISSEGKKVAITMTTSTATYALPTAGATTARPVASLADFDGEALILQDEGASFGWTIKKNEGEDETVTYSITSGNNSLFATADSNRLKIDSIPDAGTDWTITENYLTAHDSAGALRYVGVYNGQDWRCYTSIVNNIKDQTLEFWVLDGEEEGDDPVVEISPIAEALAASSGDFTVKGAVTFVDGRNIYIQDETGGICLFLASAPSGIAFGDTVIGSGSKTVYNGLPELSGASAEKTTEGAIELTARETTLGALTNADICTYVTIKDLTITSISGDNYNVEDSDSKTSTIYKPVLGDLTLEVGDVIDFTGAVGMFKSLQLRNTLASDIVKHDSTDPDDPPVETVPVSTALAGDTGSEFTVKGVVTLLDGRNVYLQDDTGGIDMYLDAAPSELSLGDTVIFTGTRATFRGLPELTGADFTRVEKESQKIELIAKQTSLGELSDADVCTYVKIKNLTVTAVSGTNITVKDGTEKTIQIYKSVLGDTALEAGDVIDFTGAVGIYNTTLQLRNTQESEIKKHSDDPYEDIDKTLNVYEIVTQPADGDKVVIYNADSGNAVTSTLKGNYYLTGENAVSVEQDLLTSKAEAIEWTVKVNDDGSYTFTQDDKYLAGKQSGNYNNISLSGEDSINWALEECSTENKSFYMYNKGMTTSDDSHVYLEWYARYTEFSLYKTSSANEKEFGMVFYKLVREGVPEEVGDLITDLSQLEDGQYVAIYSPGHKTAISSKDNGDWYLKAKPATIENGKVGMFTSDFVWKIKINPDGSYSFISNDEETNSITVWPQDTYAEVTVKANEYLNITDPSKGDNKWTLTPAKTANSFYISSPSVSGEKGPAYLEAYVRNGSEVFSGYFTQATNSNFNESDFALQLYAINPADAVPPYDDGEWDGVMNKGDKYVIYNNQAGLALGQIKEANATLDAVPSTLTGDDPVRIKAGNGAYVFTVDTKGRYYTFENNGKYLATNAKEEMKFVEAVDGVVPEAAKWYLTPKDEGGYIIYNKDEVYNGSPICIEYYSSVFSGYTFSTKNDIGIYLFNFYPVAEGTHIHEGVVQDPTAVFDCANFRYVEQDFPITITLEDLCPDIVNAKITYETIEYVDHVEKIVKTGEITDYKESSDKKNYTFTIPASELDIADDDTGELPGSFNIRIEVTNGFGISYTAERNIGINDLPFFEDLTPAPGSQTGDDLKPAISARLRNAGDDPTVTMSINGEEIKDFTFEDGIVSYKPSEDLTAGKTTVNLHATRKDHMAGNKIWSFVAGNADYQMYFGQLHSHTTYSDGSGTLETALDYIESLPESANVQFVAFTDHSNYFDTASAANPADALNDKSLMTDASRDLWEKYKGAVADFNNRNTDVKAIAGFEMTWSGGPGHINTFDSDGLVSRNNALLNNKTGDTGMKAYYETINKGDSMSQFNHPGTTFGNFKDFAYWNEETDDHMFLVEVGNGEGQIGAGGYYPSYEEYVLALDRGWHVAPTNNQDNHKGLWGNANDARDVVLTNDFSEQGIYEAIRARRVYATEDKNLQLVYTVNDEPMGTIFESAPEKLDIMITNYDPDNIDTTKKVELISNGGKVVHTWDDEESLSTGTFTAEITPEDSYYFVRVTQSDKDLAVTAPVWVGSSIKAGIDAVAVPETAVVDTDTTLTTTFFNNENSNANVKSVTYTTDGSMILGTDSKGYALPAEGTVDVPFTFKPDTAKRMKITVTAVVEINGTEQTYTKDVTLSVRKSEGPLEVSSIDEVQAQTEEGYEYAIEGVVTSNASGYDKDTAFFDCIYVQDETAGICCFPVSGEYKIGDKVHIEGYTDFYQGEAELQVEKIELIGDGSITPTEVTAAQINDQSVLGSLVTLKGTVESFEEANGLIQTIMVKDAQGDIARVFIDGYITTGREVEGCEVGAEISATGLASYDDTFNAPGGPFPRIRIRDRADIVCGPKRPGPEEVEAAVNELPSEVTTEDEEAIENAREMYDALTDAEKEALPKEILPKLEAAEARLTAAKAKAAAAAAQAEAEAAAAEAEAAKNDAEKAAEAAAAAEEAKEKADATAAAAKEAKEKADATAAAAEAARIAAEEKAKAASEGAAAEAARIAAEEKAKAETAASEAEAARKDAEKAAEAAAAAKKAKEKADATAEAAEAAAKEAKEKADATAAAAEAARIAAEEKAKAASEGAAADTARADEAIALAINVVDSSKIKASKYKYSTSKPFRKALKEAEKILRNPDASAEELKAANEALTSASAGLVLKLKNPMKVKGKTVKLKASRVKKKTRTIKRKKALTVKKAKGKVTYRKISGNSRIKVNKKTGKITVRKGLNKGTYKIKVKVTAAGNGTYKKKTLTRTFRIRVK